MIDLVITTLIIGIAKSGGAITVKSGGNQRTLTIDPETGKTSIP